MKPNQTLINAIRSVADKIETDPNLWSWGDFEYCNCGLLAQELGLTQDSLMEVFYSGDVDFISWAEFGKKYDLAIEDCECESTGLEIKHIINTLTENGIEPKDLEDIEFLHIDLDSNIQSKEVLIRNFRELANDLQAKV